MKEILAKSHTPSRHEKPLFLKMEEKFNLDEEKDKDGRFRSMMDNREEGRRFQMSRSQLRKQNKRHDRYVKKKMKELE